MGVKRPELLYLSPVAPVATGNGLAMRAGTVLTALAEHYDVSLVVIPRNPRFQPPVHNEFAKLCRRVEVIAPPGRSWWSRLARDPFAAYGRARFDVVHVFRLAMARFARPFAGRTASHLDLDDIESLTHRRIAALCRANGDTELAAEEERLASEAEPAEEEAFAGFDRIYVCSEDDRAKLQGRTRAEICVMPNAVRTPEAGSAGALTAFRFLFVGTLGYYPNDDGARYFCEEILPRIRSQWLGECRVEIVGLGASRRLAETASRAGVHLNGWVGDLAPIYRETGAVIVPVRAGGGTRIKVLEAFAWRRPVVTTRAGIEGIDARHEEHVLIADTPGDFARQCVRLMEDQNLRERLSANAWTLFEQRYSTAALQRTIASTLPPRLRKESQSDAASPCAR